MSRTFDIHTLFLRSLFLAPGALAGLLSILTQLISAHAAGDFGYSDFSPDFGGVYAHFDLYDTYSLVLRTLGPDLMPEQTLGAIEACMTGLFCIQILSCVVAFFRGDTKGSLYSCLEAFELKVRNFKAFLFHLISRWLQNYFRTSVSRAAEPRFPLEEDPVLPRFLELMLLRRMGSVTAA